MRRIVLVIFIFLFLIANNSYADVHIREQIRLNSEQIELPDPISVQFYRPTLRSHLFMIPADGRVSSTYGWRRDPITMTRRFHAGIDLANLKESTVRAAAKGRVMHAGWASGCGQEVMIEHSGGLTTRYCHLMSSRVARGDRVGIGEAIGVIGSSGRSTGPHLHFELIKMGRAIDPSPYLSLWSSDDGINGTNEIIAINRVR